MFKAPAQVHSLAKAIRDKFGARTYIVGGALRDTLLKNPIKDIDLATSALPDDVMSLDGVTEGAFHFRTIPSGIQFGTVTILVIGQGQGEAIEVTTLRKDISCDGRGAKVDFTLNLREDLERRDFTMNALALQVGGDKLVDYFNGIEDIQAKVIRAVGDPNKRIREDHLRMLRACRFLSYDEDFVLDEELKQAIRKNARRIRQVSKERIQAELIKIMSSKIPSRSIREMAGTNLLKHVIPPLAKCIGVDQNLHHAESVYEHCVAVCDHIEPERPTLRLAGLLHDIGKPETKDGQGPACSFHNHEITGARIAYDYLREYKFPIKVCEYISLMTRHHMFHFDSSSKPKAIKRWLKKVKGHEEDLFRLRMADRAGNKAKAGKPLVTSHMLDLMDKIKKIKTEKQPMQITDLAISGKDFIEAGYKPGPTFGIVLKKMLERVLEDPSLNKKEVLLEEALIELEKEYK